jgi:putative ABC transport system substrate-binding protein
VPSAARVAVLGNATDPFTKVYVKQIQLAARTLAIEVQPLMVSGDAKLDAGFAAMISERAAAVIVQPSLPFTPAIELALKYRLPALSHDVRFARSGQHRLESVRRRVFGFAAVTGRCWSG